MCVNSLYAYLAMLCDPLVALQTAGLINTQTCISEKCFLIYLIEDGLSTAASALIESIIVLAESRHPINEWWNVDASLSRSLGGPA